MSILDIFKGKTKAVTVGEKGPEIVVPPPMYKIDLLHGERTKRCDYCGLYSPVDNFLCAGCGAPLGTSFTPGIKPLETHGTTWGDTYCHDYDGWSTT
jgi:hypothetical protein